MERWRTKSEHDAAMRRPVKVNDGICVDYLDEEFVTYKGHVYNLDGTIRASYPLRVPGTGVTPYFKPDLDTTRPVPEIANAALASAKHSEPRQFLTPILLGAKQYRTFDFLDADLDANGAGHVKLRLLVISAYGRIIDSSVEFVAVRSWAPEVPIRHLDLLLRVHKIAPITPLFSHRALASLAELALEAKHIPDICSQLYWADAVEPPETSS